MVSILNNLNLSDEKVNALLKMAAAKLGKNPEELKSQLQSGSLDNLNLSPDASKQVQNFLNNPKAREELLANPNVKNMLANMMGKK